MAFNPSSLLIASILPQLEEAGNPESAKDSVRYHYLVNRTVEDGLNLAAKLSRKPGPPQEAGNPESTEESMVSNQGQIVVRDQCYRQMSGDLAT
jgi:hypothetical protein